MPKTPSASENIPIVNAYKNVFSSNIFTYLPLVHTLNPDFLGQQLWLCFSVSSWMSSRVTPELGPWQIPESAVLRSSRHRQPEVPGFRMFVTPFLHRIKILELRTFTNSRLRRFLASENREFPAPKKHVSRTLSNLTFRGWRVFLNSPTGTPAVAYMRRLPTRGSNGREAPHQRSWGRRGRVWGVGR
jgi:hypothetical protein